jgi:hypothetical protein
MILLRLVVDHKFCSIKNRIQGWPCVGRVRLPFVYVTGELGAAALLLPVVWPLTLACERIAFG